VAITCSRVRLVLPIGTSRRRRLAHSERAIVATARRILIVDEGGPGTTGTFV
jgi:hypothetical protein